MCAPWSLSHIYTLKQADVSYSHAQILDHAGLRPSTSRLAFDPAESVRRIEMDSKEAIGLRMPRAHVLSLVRHARSWPWSGGSLRE